MLTKQQFITAAKAIINQLDLDSKFSEALRLACPSAYCFYETKLIYPMIELLETTSGDIYSWFSYWLFDLEQGKKWDKRAVTLSGKKIKLKTLSDVWNTINKSREL